MPRRVSSLWQAPRSSSASSARQRRRLPSLRLRIPSALVVESDDGGFAYVGSVGGLGTSDSGALSASVASEASSIVSEGSTSSSAPRSALRTKRAAEWEVSAPRRVREMQL